MLKHTNSYGSLRTTSTTQNYSLGDRFIPNRGALDIDVGHFNLVSNENQNPNRVGVNSQEQHYKQALSQTLFDSPDVKKSKILSLKSKAPQPKQFIKNRHHVLYSQQCHIPVTQKTKCNRAISSQPLRVLDAPDLQDDYYLNLVDWGKNNLLAVALGSAVYLWNATSSTISCLTTLDNTPVTSVSWAGDGPILAIGTDKCETQLWDVERGSQVRKMGGHSGRVGALNWNNHILSSGSSDSNIVNHDVRVANHHISTMRGHTQEVCGLRWSPDGKTLASGGNDNILNLWSLESETPDQCLTGHNAAVKALAWCPWQTNLLATGGGTADRNIKFWNTKSGACVHSVDTGSQVCSLIWSDQYKELVSSHGYSRNEISIWRYPTMTKIAELTGHTSRVLHLALSPDGSTVCSAAGDETLRFWKIWEARNERRSYKKGAQNVNCNSSKCKKTPPRSLRINKIR